MQVDWSKVVLAATNMGYTIVHPEDIGDFYLHSNGEWYGNMYDMNSGAYTGLYASRFLAEQMLIKYKPKIRLKDVKPGQVFRCKGMNEWYNMLDTSEIPYINTTLCFLTVGETRPNVIRSFGKAWDDSEVEIKGEQTL